MNHPSFVKEIGEKFEALITKLEEFENNQTHIDNLSAQNSKHKTEEREIGCQKMMHNPVNATTIDALIDGFDNMKSKNDNCCREEKEAQSGCSDCNCKGETNSLSEIVTHDTGYIYENSQTVFGAVLKGDIDESIGTIRNLIEGEMTLIMTYFDSDTKNQITKCLKSLEK